MRRSFNWHWRHWIFPLIFLIVFLAALGVAGRLDLRAELGVPDGVSLEEFLEVQNESE